VDFISLRTVGRDPDWGNRAFGLSAIANIGPEPNNIPMLIKAGLSHEWRVRNFVMHFVGPLCRK